MTESERALAVQESGQTAATEEIDLPRVVDRREAGVSIPQQSPAEVSPAEVTIPAQPETASRFRQLSEMIPAQLATLRQYHYAVVTTDDVEAVHKMRVTTRRLQASLDLLEGAVRVRPLKRRLRRWRRMLSTVRNYDVFLLLIEQEAGSRSGAREQYEVLKTALQKRRANRAARVRKYLAKLDVVELLGTKLGLSTAAMSRLWEQPLAVDEDTSVPAADLVEAEALALEGGEPPEPDTVPVLAIDEQAAAIRAAERLEQRMAEFNALVARSHPTTDPRELHELRIAAKRVRYLLEAVTAMGFGDATQALTWLRGLQDRIGDWHDLEALEEEIVQLVSKRKFTKHHLAEAAGLLLAATQLQKRKKLLVARLFPVRVPLGLSATGRRLVRALRRSAADSQPGQLPVQ